MLVLVAGSWVYCVLTVVSAWRYRAVVPPAARTIPPISVLKPLAGIDDGLEENLASFFKQDYAEFEILFAVRTAQDAAVPLVEKLRARYPAVASRLLVTGEPPYANAKVYSLDLMLAAARHDLVVMADSDVRFAPGMLTGIAAEFQDPKLGLATCPYRAVPGRSFWSRMEALGLNTGFLGGVLVARWLDGMKFAIGPTIAARRATLAAIGGFNAVKDYLAEDFVMGKLAAEHGFGVLLSSHAIEHHIGSQPFLENLKHRLRWTRSTRRSRPRGYIGQVFTHLDSAGVAAVGGRAVLVAAGRCHLPGARRGHLGHRHPGSARPSDAALVVADAGRRHRQLSGLAGGLLREYHPVARPQVLSAAGRAFRTGAGRVKQKVGQTIAFRRLSIVAPVEGTTGHEKRWPVLPSARRRFDHGRHGAFGAGQAPVRAVRVDLVAGEFGLA